MPFGCLAFGVPPEPQFWQRYAFLGPSSWLANVCHLQICRSLPEDTCSRRFVNLADKPAFL